jgi:F-type H+-transporting ATPase subunit b
MKRVGILFASLATLAFSFPAFAGEHGAEGPLPQLDVTLYPGLIFWFVVTFGAFFLIVQFFGAPGIRKTQEKRASILGADLQAARAASEEAQKVVASYEATLAKARQEAQGTVSGLLAEAASEAEAHHVKLQKELTHRVKVAEENIASARQKAMEEAPKYINDLVVELFKKVTTVSIGTRG